jgi:hypothetical protein
VTIDLPAYAKKYGIKLDFKGYAEKTASLEMAVRNGGGWRLKSAAPVS